MGIIKYKYVKITTPDSKVYYAYERSIFWFFKRYLDLQDIPNTYWRGLYASNGDIRHYLLHKDLKEVKKAVAIWSEYGKRSKVKIEDAETKLDKHLSGE